MINREKWQKAKEIFDAALKLAPNERGQFLDETSDGDEELHREVESLLANSDEAVSFLEKPAVGEVAEIIADQKENQLINKNFSHYKIIKQIGAGGMGEVYLAHDTSELERTVALKFLPAEVGSDQKRMQRFVQEAKTVSALNHPNILTIYEFGQADSVRFIATEYVDGVTLREHIRERRLKLHDVLDIAMQIAAALNAAHEASVVHRDIKPENIMVRRDHIVKVLDFGLAKPTMKSAAVDSEAATKVLINTEPGLVMGTAHYMSPEQSPGSARVDHRTDVWSLGVVLYEMVAGRVPFEGKDIHRQIIAIQESDPPPLSRFAEGVPERLEEIVRKALAKDPDERYQTAKDLLIDLRNLKRKLHVDAEIERTGAPPKTELSVPPSGGELRWRFLRSWRALVVATSMMVIVAAVVVTLRLRDPSPSAPPEIKSLAVLPLENLSGDATQDYFADGMTEELTTSLAKIGALRVISRTSVMQYKGTRKTLPEIARELNVDAIIVGSVQRAGDRVKITAQLIYAPTDKHLWAETYERDLKDVLSLQSEVAGNIAREIQIKLTPQDQARMSSARPVNPEAYDYYLRGKVHAALVNKADNEAAIEMLERSVAIDPNFATGHAELGRAYTTKLNAFAPQEKQWEEKAFASVEKALSLDPDLAEAHLARGLLLWTHDYHFPHERAVQEYRRALSLNPNLDEAHHQLGVVYIHIGLFDKALQEIQTAVTINPSNTLAQYRVGVTYLYQGRDENALTVFYKIPATAYTSLWGYQTAWALFNLGRKDEASKTVEESLLKYPEDLGGVVHSVAAMLAAADGNETKAEEMIKRAAEQGKGFVHFHHTAYDIACAYALMNKPSPAIEWLQKAADDGLPCYPLFERDHNLDNIRRDPRFITFMAKQKEQWEYYKATLQ